MSNQFIPQLPGQIDSAARTESEHGPRLKWHHLLVWAVVGIVVYMLAETSLNLSSTGSLGSGIVLFAIIVTSLSLSFTITLLKIAWMTRGVPFLDEASHCIALESTCLSIGLLVIRTFYSNSGSGNIENPIDLPGAVPLTLFVSVIGFSFGLIFILYAKKYADTNGWTAFCSCYGILNILAGLGPIVFLASKTIPPENTTTIIMLSPFLNLFGFILTVASAAQLICTAIFFIAIFQDLMQNKYRHWSHWVAVFAHGTIYLPISLNIAYRFVQ